MLTQCRSCQTMLDYDLEPQAPIPAPRSAYERERARFVQQHLPDSAWTPTDSLQSTPTHEVAKAKTITTIPQHKDPKYIDEHFYFRQSRQGKSDGLNYKQFSEYKTSSRTNSIEKINSYLDISDNKQHPQTQQQQQQQQPQQPKACFVNANSRQARGQKAKLSHSTIEMTSVVKNKTAVSGVTVKDSSPDKFTIHIVNPNGVENIMSRQNQPEGWHSCVLF
jgi:hypothetical protein